MFLAVALVSGILAWIIPGHVNAASAKITICHRTHSTTNPYRRITVSQNAVQTNRHGGHDLPDGSLNPAVFDAGFGYAANNKYWGDIIPGSSDGGDTYNGSSQVALNWTTAGRDHFFGATCAAMTATQFYAVEIAADVAPADIIADLNDQAANEDLALLAALGGSFTSGNIDSWTTAVSVTTNAATSVTTTTATLNGSLTVGSTSTVSGFEYGTSPTLSGASSVAATPSIVTSTTAVTAAIAGLTPSTTYFFRVTGTTNAGADTEGVLLGQILSFTTGSGDGGTTEPATTAAPTTIAAPTTAPTTTAPTTTAATTTEPATTAPATTAAPAAPPGGAGEVRGIVWFDRNRDGRLSTGEWVLPGATVELEAVGSPTLAAVGQVGLAASTILGQTVTGADGSYLFTGLPAASYGVRAAVRIDGFEYTSDSDDQGDLTGATDWSVRVEVTNGTTSQADFAGLGMGSLTGRIFELTTDSPDAFATVTCRWSGFDDLPGTADDVSFGVIADADGAFDLTGVPYGAFSCSGTDAIGRTSPAVESMILGPELVTTELPVDPLAPTGLLPNTGGDARRHLLVAIALIAFGWSMVRVRRRSTSV